MSLNTFDKKVLAKYEAFFVEEDETIKTSLKIHIRNEIESLDGLSSLHYQLLGLIDYESDDWQNHLPTILSNFQKSVSRDSSNFMAQLYLAHTYHDSGKLKASIRKTIKR